MTDQKKITVLGIGNLLMHDDGAGIHAVQKLMNHYTFEPEIQLIDGGTMGSELLPFLKKRIS